MFIDQSGVQSSNSRFVAVPVDYLRLADEALANSGLMDNLNVQSSNSDVDGCPVRLEPENNPHEVLLYLSSKTEFREVKKIKPFLSLSPPTPKG